MNVNGIVLIDKPRDFTSFDVVAVMRGVLGTKKVGHAGTLDPMATGVLPILCGKCTKLCDILPGDKKRYTTVMKLGVTTDTQDITGKILTEKEIGQIGKKEVETAIKDFIGEIFQTPPMYSAVKVDGKKLCDLARKGIEVERKAKQITIESIEIIDFDEKKGEYTLDVLCSKGTYIRTLCSDIGDKLGCGACISYLRRTLSASFSIENCIPLEKAKTMKIEELLLPPEKAFENIPKVYVSEAQSKRYSNGGALDIARTKLAEDYLGDLLVYSNEGVLLGLAEVREGQIKPLVQF